MSSEMSLAICAFGAGAAVSLIVVIVYEEIIEKKAHRQREQNINDLIKSWHKVAITDKDLQYLNRQEANLEFMKRMFGYGLYSAPSEQTEREHVERKLIQAIESENYLEAARLRDLLKNNFS